MAEENRNTIHSLIPLGDFKALAGADDRENTLSSFVLLTATYTIEQYCRRRLLIRTVTEYPDYGGDGFLFLGEYPVREIITMSNEQGTMNNGELIDPEFYRVIPDCGDLEDIPYRLSVSPALRFLRLGLNRGEKLVRVKYRAGYGPGEVPADLASACLELAAWNMARYKGRRIGMGGMVRGSGKDGEHLEMSMPENVRLLLEPYRRRVI